MAGVKMEIRGEVVGLLNYISSITNTERWKRILRSLVAVIGIKDVRGHLRNEEGPDGKWPELSEGYGKWKRRKYPGRQMLILSGNLSRQFLPANIRDEGPLSVAFFNPVSYAGKHDRGEDGVPKRKFMWLSQDATDNMAKGLAQQILEGR